MLLPTKTTLLLNCVIEGKSLPCWEVVHLVQRPWAASLGPWLSQLPAGGSVLPVFSSRWRYALAAACRGGAGRGGGAAFLPADCACRGQRPGKEEPPIFIFPTDRSCLS